MYKIEVDLREYSKNKANIKNVISLHSLSWSFGKKFENILTGKWESKDCKVVVAFDKNDNVAKFYMNGNKLFIDDMLRVFEKFKSAKIEFEDIEKKKTIKFIKESVYYFMRDFIQKEIQRRKRGKFYTPKFLQRWMYYCIVDYVDIVYSMKEED